LKLIRNYYGFALYHVLESILKNIVVIRQSGIINYFGEVKNIFNNKL
jgi:hypothetical protein